MATLHRSAWRKDANSVRARKQRAFTTKSAHSDHPRCRRGHVRNLVVHLTRQEAVGIRPRWPSLTRYRPGLGARVATQHFTRHRMRWALRSDTLPGERSRQRV